jgi:NADH:ubiquinone oxidoreductase subunit 3 (subunit A)
MNILFSPVLAFPIYIGLVSLLMIIGRLLTDTTSTTTDSSLYGSGEAVVDDEVDKSVPGYRPFFLVSLFFAVLHLGVVILATSTMSTVAIIYLLGLMMALIALILG